MMSLSFLFRLWVSSERERERERKREIFATLASFRRKISGAHSRDKIREQREKTTRHTRCTPLRLVFPPGPSRGDTHAGALVFPACGAQMWDCSLFLSADKCLCDACCVRVSRYSFAPEYSTKATPNFFAAKVENFSAKRPTVTLEFFSPLFSLSLSLSLMKKKHT